MSSGGLHRNVLRPAGACLLVIDIQEKFAAAIPGFDCIAGNAAKLVQGFRKLGVPVVATEQYPRGLGRTVKVVADCLADSPVFEKSAFSCTGAEGFDRWIRKQKLRQVVVCGIETHVCVNQSVHAMLEQGLAVHLATDAVGSRKASDHQAAIRKMEASGAVPATVEMSLFELMQDAKHEHFRDVQQLIK